MFSLILLPLVSILFLCLALWLIINRRANKLLLILNLLVIVAIILILVDAEILQNNYTDIEAWIYWTLIVLGIVMSIVSSINKHLAGQLMAAGILLFMAYIALFSIGIIFLIIFLIQLYFVISTWKECG